MTTDLLVQRSIGGDVDAFTELVTRYQGMAFSYALATLGDYQLAEDATQQAFLTAWRNLGSLRDQRRFGGWLRGIVRYECLRLIRDRTRHRSESLDAVGAPDRVDAASDVERDSEISIELQDAIAQMALLPEQQRVVAQLYYLGDQTQLSVAEFLGLSVSTVNNRLREARAALRREGVFPMSKQTNSTPSFSESIGKVIRSQTQTIDAVFNGGTRPPLLTGVTIGDDERAITAFIAQYLDDDVVRMIVTGEEPEPVRIVAGSTVHSHGQATDSRVSPRMIDGLVDTSRTSTAKSFISTGIKVIDLFAPLTPGGVLAIVGAQNVGKLVVVEELVSRLTNLEQGVTVMVFLTSPDELGVAHTLSARTDGPVTTMLVPVADASAEALMSSLGGVDTVIAMSSELASEGHYPAIDPLVSRTPAAETSSVATRAKSLLRDHPDAERSRLIRAYLTQPFFVAESYTGHPCVLVEPAVAERDLERLLTGDISGFDPGALLMRGALPGNSSFQ